MGGHISIGVSDRCINSNSYFHICVMCNACGRFDMSTRRECALKLYLHELQEALDNVRKYHNMENEDELTALQLKNAKGDVKYYRSKIKQLELQAEKE